MFLADASHRLMFFVTFLLWAAFWKGLLNREPCSATDGPRGARASGGREILQYSARDEG